MKKVLPPLIYLLVFLILLFPAGAIITSFLGYTIEPINIPFYLITIVVLSISIIILDIFSKNTTKNKAIRILLAVITPLSLINPLFYFVLCVPIRGLIITELFCANIFVAALFSAGCCCYLAVKYGRPVVLKVISLVLSALMILPIGYLSIVLSIFGSIGQTSVVQTIESPNSAYCAKIISSDQGALGGDTIVEVCDNKPSEINLVFFKLEKESKIVYTGSWTEHNNINVFWKDNSCLVINSVEYTIE